MAILGGVGKDTVIEAGKAVEAALDKVSHGVLPAAEQAGRNLEDHAVYGMAGIVADIANRLNGASLPVDITITATVQISGQIGALKITAPEYALK